MPRGLLILVPLAVSVAAAQPPSEGHIAFVSSRGGPYAIYLMNADGSEQRKLTTERAAEFHPAWSPDGTEIAFASDRAGNDEIYVMASDGTRTRRLTWNPVTIDDQPSWSPDGTTIAFARGVRPPGHNDICVIEPDGSGYRRLTWDKADDVEPDWQPQPRS